MCIYYYRQSNFANSKKKDKKKDLINKLVQKRSPLFSVDPVLGEFNSPFFFISFLFDITGCFRLPKCWSMRLYLTTEFFGT